MRDSWSRPGDNKVADDFEGAEKVLVVARVCGCLDLDLETRLSTQIPNWLCGRLRQFNARMNQVEVELEVKEFMQISCGF